MSNTVIDEIADGICRRSTFVADVSPTGITFSQFLIVDDERLLFDAVGEAVATIVPIETVGRITRRESRSNTQSTRDS